MIVFHVDVHRYIGWQCRHDLVEARDPGRHELVRGLADQELPVRRDRVVPDDKLIIDRALDVELDPREAVLHRGEVGREGVLLEAFPGSGAEAAVPDQGGFHLKDH